MKLNPREPGAGDRVVLSLETGGSQQRVEPWNRTGSKRRRVMHKCFPQDIVDRAVLNARVGPFASIETLIALADLAVEAGADRIDHGLGCSWLERSGSDCDQVAVKPKRGELPGDVSKPTGRTHKDPAVELVEDAHLLRRDRQ